MCLFILTRKDGTPFDVTSVTEEDIIKICMGLGHTHPMGVLCYSAMELVALFLFASDMQCTACGDVKTIVLHHDEVQVRAYMVVVDGEPLGTQPPALEGEVHLPTGNPQPSGETLQCLQASRGDLADKELHQLMEDLHQEVALCELDAPLRSHPPRPWEKPTREWKSKSG